MVTTSARRTLPRRLTLSAAVLMLIACSSGDSPDSTGSLSAAVVPTGGTDPAASAARYPLAIGNYWTYEGSFSIRDVNNTDPGDVLTIARTERHEIIGSEEWSGRTYLVRENTIDEGVWGVTQMWGRLRQTMSGLYQLDILSTTPPLNGMALAAGPTRMNHRWERFAAGLPDAERAAYRRAWDEIVTKRALLRDVLAAVVPPERAPADGEITSLAYPLHTGATWAVREEPFLVTARVEGREIRDVPAGREPAWRVRIYAEFLSPDDRAWSWYGKSGLVEQSVHVVVEATDENGQPIGLLVSDDVMVLTAASSGRPHGDD